MSWKPKCSCGKGSGILLVRYIFFTYAADYPCIFSGFNHSAWTSLVRRIHYFARVDTHCSTLPVEYQLTMSLEWGGVVHNPIMYFLLKRVDASPSTMEVVAGDHRINRPEGSEQRFDIDGMFVHPHYQTARRPAVMNNGVALIRIRGRIRYTDQVSPICLLSSDLPPGYTCTVTGWGHTQGAVNILGSCCLLSILRSNKQQLKCFRPGTGSSSVLNQLDVPLIAQNVCRTPRMYYRAITDDMICAGYSQGGKDSCKVHLLCDLQVSFSRCQTFSCIF